MADVARYQSHLTITDDEPECEVPIPEGSEPPLSPGKPPLGAVTFPRLFPSDPNHIAYQGWAPMPIGDVAEDPFAAAIARLFATSRQFFEQPLAVKTALRSPIIKRSIGYGRDPGRKEQFTIRNVADMPAEMREAAVPFWNMAGAMIDEWLGHIETSLEMPLGSLTAFSKPSMNIHENEDRATMLRFFRYETHEQQVLGEAHKDVGLMTIVIGDQPGLELGDKHSENWYPIERDLMVPAASVLIGEELENLTNGRYQAGVHQVVSYTPGVWKDTVLRRLAPGKPDVTPVSEGQPPLLTTPRYSLVYLVRSHWPVVIDTDKLTTPITGRWKKPLHTPAINLYEKIRHMA